MVLPVHVPVMASSNGHVNGQKADVSTMPDVVITTYSKLHGWADYLAGVVKSVIFDEAQELRRVQSLKYQAAEGVARAADFRMGLSATPIHNYGGEYFNVLEVLRPGALGTHAEFITEHCIESGRGWSVKDAAAFGSRRRARGLFEKRPGKEGGRELPPLNQVVETVDADLNHLRAIESSATELAKIILRTGGKLSPAVHQQVIGRLYRDGQTEPVFAYFLVAEHGSDPVVSDVLGLKREQHIGVLDPGHPVVVEKTVDPEHVKKLARAYLRSKGIEAV